MVERPSRRSGSGRETPRMSESGQESLPEVRKWLGSPLGGWEDLPNVSEGLLTRPGSLGGPPKPPEGPPDPFWTFEKAFRPLPNH